MERGSLLLGTPSRELWVPRCFCLSCPTPCPLPCLHRPQDSDLTVLVVVLTFLPAPVMLAMVYGFWKKKHMGSEWSHL